jgi:hypothetical protein
VARPEDSAIAAVEWSLWLDTEAGKAVECLEREGIPAILLKGAVIATWLYDDGTPRSYSDVDLLVPPAEFDRAAGVLGQLGYEPNLELADPYEADRNERVLVNGHGTHIDLHRYLVGTPADRCWEVLSRHTVPFGLVGRTVTALDLAARTMHLATHAAQDGPGDAKAISDLDRGLRRLPVDLWRDAADVARELGALAAFAAGLRLIPDGAALVASLGLSEHMSVELSLRVRSAPLEALFFERLRAAPGLRRKAALVGHKLFPSATYVRANSELARRGPLGLAAARLLRPLSLLGRVPPALTAWWRAREAGHEPRRQGREVVVATSGLRPLVASFPPGRGHVRVPVATRRGALHGLSLYAPVRLGAVAGQAAAFALVAVTGGRLLGRASPWAPPMSDQEWDELCGTWSSQVGPFDTVALYHRPQASRGGIAALLLRDGSSVAFLKLRTEPGGLDNEQKALGVPPVPQGPFTSPTVLGAGTSGGWHWLATSPMPCRPALPPRSVPPQAVITEVQRRLGTVLEPRSAPVGWLPMHGDLTPWNLRRLAGAGLWLVDWEDSAYGPPDADDVYFRATLAAITGRRPHPGPAEACAFWEARVRNRGLGDEDHQFREQLLHVLHTMAL